MLRFIHYNIMNIYTFDMLNGSPDNADLYFQTIIFYLQAHNLNKNNKINHGLFGIVFSIE